MEKKRERRKKKRERKRGQGTRKRGRGWEKGKRKWERAKRTMEKLSGSVLVGLTTGIAVPGWFLTEWHFAITPPFITFAFPNFGSQSTLKASAFPARCSGTWRLGPAKCRTPDVPERAQGSNPNTRTPRAGHPLLQAAFTPQRAPSPSALLLTLLLAGVSAQTRPVLPPWARHFPARASHWCHLQLQHGLRANTQSSHGAKRFSRAPQVLFPQLFMTGINVRLLLG